MILGVHRSFGAMWALADEAIIVRRGTAPVSPPPGTVTNWDFIEAWFRRFETLTQLSL